jgi:hypothetical protein
MLEIRTEVDGKVFGQVGWSHWHGSEAKLIAWKVNGISTRHVLIRPEGEVYEPVRFVAQLRREVRGGKHLLEAVRRVGAGRRSGSLALPIFVGTGRYDLYFPCLSTADAREQQEGSAD